MNDKGKIVIGLVIFLILISFPFWYNHGKAGSAPVIQLSEKAKAAGECVENTPYMKAEHMQLLDIWRDQTVRKGNRVYKNRSGKSYTISLSSGENSCLGCHTDKAQFCDKCHDYASVKPYCWDCHIDPKEKM